MGECINKFFIYNGEVKESKEFDVFYPKSKKLLYEVIRVIDKTPLFLKEHFERLDNSIALANLTVNFSEKHMRESILKLIQENSVEDGNVKLILDEENILVYSVKHSYPTKEMYDNGVKTLFYFGERENPNAKIVNKTFREEIDKILTKTHSYEAILVNKEGYITEGSRSNIFMVKGSKVYTAPLETVLPGVTRKLIIKVCEVAGLEVLEESIHHKEINNLDALFISGTSPKVLPISELEGVKYKSVQNEVVKKIIRKFDELIIKNLGGFNEFL
ncbi:branched-chain amino acid aminotransferase [Clostridium punense]|uniref:Branched-chain amino acid aminotransferase n=1 Tax=Clostridium punense TaxID=1054297 RepID=A0ABS4K241_9CLOT|nr:MULTISPECIES: aminotransferase class IV [Clostridium]EQB88527.1 hypothetical protein M918_03795 [Clostridium sp. BL8]MBP2021849.1 branched-chain amino acid aminotransferase [Clostridium punense]